MLEAIAHVKKHAQIFGVSCDLDILDPQESQGVGSPETKGISAKELLKGLAVLKRDPDFKAFELVEYNPERDIREKTLNISFEILLEVMER